MRLLSGNPGMYQHSVEHNTEGETTQHEPEHGEDTIARVKGTQTIPGRHGMVSNFKSWLGNHTGIVFCHKRFFLVVFLSLKSLSNMLLLSALQAW